MEECACCGRAKNEVKALIAGKKAKICNRCIEQGAAALQETEVRDVVESEEIVLKKPREIYDHLNQYVISQDRAKRDIAIAVYNHFKRRKVKGGEVDGVTIQKSNILMTGPSGTGKTEIARAVANLLNVPFYVADATRLTSAGHVGDDVESILQGLLRDASRNVERAQWGIVFVDEIDKIARKSGKHASEYKDPTGEAVQQALLKIVEGSIVPVPEEGSRVGGGGRVTMMDTTNILFIGAGSFAGIEEIVRARSDQKGGLGFGAAERKKVDIKETYEHLTEEDFLEFGIIPELLGRLPVHTTTLHLSEDDMVRILTEPKNALIQQFKALFKIDGIDLQFDDEALRAIGSEAKSRTTGARALRGIVERILQPLSFDLPSDPTVRAVRITEASVKGEAEPVILREEVAQAVG